MLYVNSFKKTWLTKIQNSFMVKGKRFVIEKLAYGLFTKGAFINLMFIDLLEILHPKLGLQARRKKRQLQYIPTPNTKYNQYCRAVRWFKLAIRIKTDKSLTNRILNEFTDVMSENRTYSTRLRNDWHRRALAMRAFTHWRWH